MGGGPTEGNDFPENLRQALLLLTLSATVGQS